MTEDATQVKSDRFSLSLAAEGISRALSFVSGFLSGVLLFRAIGWSWTTNDYDAMKVLGSINMVLLPLVVLGTTGAAVRVVASFRGDREKLGQTIGSVIAFTTLAFFVTSVGSTLLGLDVAFLGPGTTLDLDPDLVRFYWILVILSLLPTAYMRIARAVFTGIVQVKRVLVVDIIYSGIKIGLIVYLFSVKLITLETVLWLSLIAAGVAGFLSLAILNREMKRNSIPWRFRPSSVVVSGLARLSGVFLVSALVTVNFTDVTVLWMNAFGTPNDIKFYSVAKGIAGTVMDVLGAPLILLGPSLAAEYSAGRWDQYERKFREGYRVVVPTLAFANGALFAFARPILRVYGGAAGPGATIFLQMVSFELFFVTLPAIYAYVFLAANDTRGLLYSSISQALIQTVWVILMTPILGVSAIALIWVAYIPFFFVQHQYTRVKHKLVMRLRTVASGLFLGLAFAVVMYSTVETVFLMVAAKLVLPTIIEAALICLLVVPFWYLFLGVATITGVFDTTDLNNIQAVLKVVPPAWWFSKPIIATYLRYSEKRSGVPQETFS